MKIQSIMKLEIPDVAVIRFEKFNDERGYFTEIYNINDLNEQCDFLRNYNFQQVNEAFSFQNTFRGLHFQCEPLMGKLVRLIYGKLIDFALDLRPASPTYKHILGYELKSTCQYSEWIWLPPGFAHGTLLLENSMIEYFCTGTYNQHTEHTVSVFSDDIEWTLCDSEIIAQFNNIDKSTLRIKKRDLEAENISELEKKCDLSKYFLY